MPVVGANESIHQILQKSIFSGLISILQCFFCCCIFGLFFGVLFCMVSSALMCKILDVITS